MHTVLLKTIRNNFLDASFYGSIFLADRNKIYFQAGENSDTISFMRSLAKPLQASILFDTDINFTNKELAIFSGSHAGSKTHINFLKNILKKYKINNADLSICPIEPLDKRNFNGRKTKLHNNCSGKHIMMLIACKYFHFDSDYTNPNNPVQKLIKERQEDLSEYKSDILTFDGCSTPLWGLPYENIIIAYFNLIEKYPALIQAIIKNPYIYGGYNRFDSEIIKLGKGNLFAKVGAGGFVIIYNIKKKQILLVKMAQDNNDARKIVTIDYLNKIGWLNVNMDNNIYNQKKQIVAKYEFSL